MERLTEVVDEQDWGFGWVAPERRRLRLASHGLLADGGVWVVDPLEGEGVEERLRRLGEPAGVIQLLDRHGRDCAAFAQRLGVPHHVVPFRPVGPFEAIPLVRRRQWQETALWWPERRVLVCADALGTVPHYFALGGERLGVHPLLRLTPPSRLAELEPEHVLCGHGAGVHERAAEAVRDAVAHARRRLPRLLVEAPAAALRR
ncbi:MAG: hypothetical protein ACJ76O_14210 [Gaiellaceae bacterium]